MSSTTHVKRKRASKKNKKSWRKSINLTDVENFLDDQRLEERLGGSFNEKTNEELFAIDKTSVADKGVLTKKEKAALPPRCFEILNPWTSVSDPISKRNRVRTKEQRQSSIRKLIEETKRKNGIVKKKDIIAKHSRKLTEDLKKNVPKKGEFNKDIWLDEHENVPIADAEWLEDETKRHLLKTAGQLKVRHPKSFVKNPLKWMPSSLPATEAPHPGISYNPSFTDHQQLLKDVAEKEYKVMKEEEHLKRVTSNMFSAVTPEENHNLWISEMSEGLDKTPNPEDANHGGDYSTLNPPTSFTKKKSLKTRRKQKEAKKEALALKYKRMEKKKTADLYKLRMITKEIEEKQAKIKIVKAKREKKQTAREKGTKKLSKRKYEEPDIQFNRPHEITGSLRALKPEGNLLADRFFSMQKRNILEVTAKQLKCHKRKVKKFTKASHKTEESPTLIKKKK